MSLGANKFLSIQLMAVLYAVFSNVVHPITPTFNRLLGLEKYMFGVFFAAMALGSFLFSPLWGRLSDTHGRKVVLAVTLFGYAVCQLLFGYSHEPDALTLLRFFAGCFTGGTTVVLMALIVDITDDDEGRTKRLFYYTAATSVSIAGGFFLGGMIGTLSLKAVFWIQFIGLVSCGLLALFTTPQTEARSSATPHISYHQVARMLPLPLLLFFGAVMLANLGTYGYDGTFNTMITADYQLPTSANGIVKAITGVLGLLANIYINPWLLRKFEIHKALNLCLVLCALTLLLLLPNEGMGLFFSVNLVFYAFNAMYMPIQQALLSEQPHEDFGLMSGMFNAMRYLGMVIGGLAAGFLYARHRALSTACAAAGFLLAAALTQLSLKLGKRSEQA